MTNYMRTSQTSPALLRAKAAEAYHHGDLRAALISAAREALETLPPEAVTLKSLALRLGVSQPAPYRHFAGREALMSAVAADGFVRLLAALNQAADAAAPEERDERCCLAYLDFGQANTGVYRLMFSASALRGSVQDGALQTAAATAFERLLSGVAEGVEDPGAYARALWLWSALHGMVLLTAEGLLSGPRDPDRPKVTTEAMVKAIVKGLRRA
jgi:AcrR family transcriptional regulator